MENIKVTAQVLAEAGWAEAQIDRFYKLLDRKIKHGLSALTVTDRRFYNSAQVTANKWGRQREAAAVEGTKRSVHGKLHFRYEEATRRARAKYANLGPTEVSAHLIIAEVHLATLEKFQPTLDMCDTSQRHQVYGLNSDFLLHASLLKDARRVNVDRQALLKEVKEEMGEDWNPKFDEEWLSHPDFDDVVFSDTEAEGFREIVRELIELAMIRAFRSLRRHAS
jgi:hypothetical protein